MAFIISTCEKLQTVKLSHEFRIRDKYLVQTSANVKVLDFSDFILIFEGKIYSINENLKKLSLKTDLEELFWGFKSFGEDAFDLIQGAYSFLLISKNKNQVIGVKDHFGTKPLYIYKNADTFTLSNDIKLLIKEYKPTLNFSKVENYFNFIDEYQPIKSTTFFREITQILPAHYLKIDDGFVSNQQLYWNFREKIQLNEKDKSSIQSEFYQILKTAVAKRLEKSDSIWANLSGGLDSSSLCAILSNDLLQLHTIYFDAKDKLADEKDYIDVMLQNFSFKHHIVETDVSPISNVKHLIEILGQPDRVLSPTTMMLEVASKVQNCGGTQIFSGSGGDNVISYGNSYFEVLLEEKKWTAFKESVINYLSKRKIEIQFPQAAKFSKSQKNQYYIEYLLFNFLQKKIKKNGFKEFILSLYEINKYLNITPYFYVTRLAKGLKIRLFKKSKQYTLYKRKNKKAEFDIEQAEFRFTDLSQEYSNFQKNHISSCFTNITNATIEQQILLYERFGIDTLFPFFDKDVFEFAVSVPIEILFDDGWMRGTLREAMAGVLPNKVRLRTSKASFEEYQYSILKKLWQESTDILNSEHPTWKILNFDEFIDLIGFTFNENIPLVEKHQKISLAYRTISFALWLDYLQNTYFYSFSD